MDRTDFPAGGDFFPRFPYLAGKAGADRAAHFTRDP
jgi:hypothetical protein